MPCSKKFISPNKFMFIIRRKEITKTCLTVVGGVNDIIPRKRHHDVMDGVAFGFLGTQDVRCGCGSRREAKRLKIQLLIAFFSMISYF